MITLADIGSLQSHNSAITRWAKFGPYYAMFPIDFAFEVVEKYSSLGDYIIDPFAGRCSSIYAGGILGRNSLGIEINPLGWLYGTVKLSPAPKQEVIDRLFDIYNKRVDYKYHAEQMPEFFQICYCPEVLQFLLSARNNLDWENNSIDGTLMSILLVYLHGKLGEGLSNQMRQTKAMGVNYSINWWKSKNMSMPPIIEPLSFIMKKIEWRYAKDIPPIYTDCGVVFGDSTLELEDIIKKSKQEKIKYSLLFTSPPYWSIVDYHADQWLRLWLLGGETFPKSNEDKHKRRFNSKVDYQNLLQSVFSNCAEIMAKKSTIFVRTDAREFTFQTTLEILTSCFPKHEVTINKEPFKKKTQTELFNGSAKPSEKFGEIDIILERF
jgi:hypothetical protein